MRRHIWYRKYIWLHTILYFFIKFFVYDIFIIITLFYFIRIRFWNLNSWVNHEALLYELCLLGIGGPVFNVLKDLLSEKKQWVAVDGKFSNTERVLPDVPQGSVLGPLFILFTPDLGDNLENKICTCACKYYILVYNFERISV